MWADVSSDGLPAEPEAAEELLVARWVDALAYAEVTIHTAAGRRQLARLFRFNPALFGLVLEELCDA